MEAKPKEIRRYGISIQVLEREGLRTIYRMPCTDGMGTMISYSLLPGIELVYNRFQAQSCHVAVPPQWNIMEINHCRKGRFECEFRRGSYTYLSEGDIAINMMGNQASGSGFPLGIYEGVALMIDIDEAQPALHAAMQGVSINLPALRRRVCPEECCYVAHATAQIEQTFQCLYALKQEMHPGLARLKVLELLLLLMEMPQPAHEYAMPYFRKELAERIKRIHAHLISDLDRHVTIEQLALEHGIGLTQLKSGFKAIYGQSIFAYMRSFRVHAAAVRLLQSRESIAAIAGSVGYENASKFAAAFRSITGVSPLEYRRTKRS